MSCKKAYFDGWGSCKKLLPKVNGAILTKKGTTFTDAELQAIATWQTAIAATSEASRTAMYLPVMNFENTTDDVTINKTPLGKAYKDGNPIPTGVLYLDAGFNDYKALSDYEGVEFDIFFLLQDGLVLHTETIDGANKGFRCDPALKYQLPIEDKLMSYPFYLFFDNYEEFERGVMADYGYAANDIDDLSPAGLDIEVVTAYTGGDVVVKVTKRGSGTGLTGLAAADFAVLDSNATPTVAVTAATDDGLGQYTLTVKKDNDGTPANLAATDYAIIQASEDDGSNVTYLSHALKFKGGA